MIPTTLVTGSSSFHRDTAILSQLDPALHTAIILEGLSDGRDVFPSPDVSRIQLHRIAAGCMCCTGNLVMRVTLNRLLRSKPDRLFISVANDLHLAQLRDVLKAPPYDQYLNLTDDLLLP
ncbi:MAG: GTPase [Oxalicibacterium faecigallinarum]|uniref:GTPase n=1 Tax=Oxalicibacterium faecigallinarum TaxID=573741 RepID=UPI00280983AD|nr:GTPase [Oxalicibacterium faecigallinarum]MDQ7968976.1 GTPase [Oxalicibacterium faecigallinarum]